MQSSDIDLPSSTCKIFHFIDVKEENDIKDAYRTHRRDGKKDKNISTVIHRTVKIYLKCYKKTELIL